MTEFFKRVATIAVLVFILALLFLYGSNTSLVVSIYLVTLLSFHEWLRISSKSKYYIFPFFILIYVLDYNKSIDIGIYSLFFLSLLIIMMYLTFNHESYLREKIKQHSLFYGVILNLSFFLFLTNLFPYDNTLPMKSYIIDNKHYYIILISLVSFIDMSAYLSGKLFGKNKITSAISPNKTYEGYIGALVLTVFTFIVISDHFNFQWTFLDIILLLIFIMMVYFGDLLMRLIKRVFEIKDTGSLLPGHGGILDRLDSYFTSLPIFYLWFLF
jgi:phosphatidate cytidylyltransferase